MAEVVGQNGLHNVRGFLCDLCGHACDPEAQELNALDCTFGNCPKTSAVYHQDCLEKYLKSVRLEKYVFLFLFRWVKRLESQPAKMLNLNLDWTDDFDQDLMRASLQESKDRFPLSKRWAISAWCISMTRLARL